MKKNIFRMTVLLLSFFLFSFTKREALKDSKDLNGDETSRRLWGWGCPSCTFTGLGTGSEMNYTCTSTYYVMGVGVSSSSCFCVVVDGTGCPSCNLSNLSCGYSGGPAREN
jgi:hypothetical protein